MKTTAITLPALPSWQPPKSIDDAAAEINGTYDAMSAIARNGKEARQ